MRRAGLLLCLVALCAWPAMAAAPEWLHFRQQAGDLVLAEHGSSAEVVVADEDHEVARIAAAGLRRDLLAVTGARQHGAMQVWIGTLGHSPMLDRLVAAGRIDATRLKGAWESFVMATVANPAPDVPMALVVLGSDRRGTAFGAYELSRAIGVSPWHWWADVPPVRHEALYVARGTQRFGPPSVRYRGIFLNDEDWGLVPWAAHTLAPGEPAPGPTTYARVYDLLLRLKANTIWPAMHRISRAFNADPANAALADRHGIVVGSSHSEPMLRNNVGEWKGTAEQFNYLTNAPAVRAYWQERVATNARYETIWTLGQRGIHDSAMIGPDSKDARRATLERIFADQRAMLAQAGLKAPPQVFTPYKEVLDIYNDGLDVPDDVTLVWPDDNFGYLRHFPTDAERARSGGAGVYYHLSYLGAPLSYLWLSTTPPALIREEMGRAFDAGARRLWIANVGDLKPAEMDIAYFLDLAWDVQGVRDRPIAAWIADWAEETTGPGTGREVAAIMGDYYRLNFARRPEHLQPHVPGRKPRHSPFDQGPFVQAGADARLADFARIHARMARLRDRVAPAYRDAFFELVDYPVSASAAANRRMLQTEAHDRLRDFDFAEALRRAGDAHAADAEIRTLTARYNGGIAGGKWRGIMAVEPADGQWRTFRATPVPLPETGGLEIPPASPATPAAPSPAYPLLRPDQFAIAGGWRLADGLGREGAMLAALPKPGKARATIDLPQGRWRVLVDLLPTYPASNDGLLHFALLLDGRRFDLATARRTGDSQWAAAVLDNRITLPLDVTPGAGSHTIVLEAEDPAIHVEAIRFVPVDGKPSAGPVSPGAEY